MQTYTETLGHKPFNWKQSLQARIRLNSSKSSELKSRANLWSTCPCGNLSVDIPRGTKKHANIGIRIPIGRPLDHILSNLGMNFCYWIANGNWTKALNILNKIEQRASEILSEIS